MQLTKKQIQMQQIILSHLGFYKNKCDGIWGPATIAAKKAFEGQKSFIPALPNSGLPFGEKEKYPKGFKMGADRLLAYSDPNGKRENDLTPEKIKKIAGDLLITDKIIKKDVKPVEALPVIEAPVEHVVEPLKSALVSLPEKKEEEKKHKK